MRRPLSLLVLIVTGILLFTACEDDPKNTRQVRESVEHRYQMFDRAESLFPLPQLQNFPMREALVKFTERQDQVAHPWYVYVLGQNGNAIGYYVASTYPQSVCNFLSSTEQIVEQPSDPDIVITAPSLDGIYYGGGGSESSCSSVFFFDLATDAMVVIGGMNFFAVDQPLLLEADPINVASPTP